jgi:hypothetical protein
MVSSVVWSIQRVEWALVIIPGRGVTVDIESREVREKLDLVLVSKPWGMKY